MKTDINTLLSELIQLDSVQEINKNNNGTLIIIMSATFDNINSIPIIALLNEYEWKVITRNHAIGFGSTSFIEVNVRIILSSGNLWAKES